MYFPAKKIVVGVIGQKINSAIDQNQKVVLLDNENANNKDTYHCNLDQMDYCTGLVLLASCIKVINVRIKK